MIKACTKAPFTRHNLLSNQFNNRLNNGLYPVYKHPTGCETGCTTRLTTAWMFVYTMQPVVQPVVQPVSQPAVSCKRGLKGTQSTNPALCSFSALTVMIGWQYNDKRPVKITVLPRGALPEQVEDPRENRVTNLHLEYRPLNGICRASLKFNLLFNLLYDTIYAIFTCARRLT